MNKSQVNTLQVVSLIVILSMIFSLSLALPPRTVRAAEAEPPYEGQPSTAFQSGLAEMLNQRQAAGLPIPEVTFGSPVRFAQETSAPAPFRKQAVAAGPSTTETTTSIFFANPQEAGYDQWPPYEITGDLAGDDSTAFTTGDFNEIYRAGVEERRPGFWEQVNFGQEGRRFNITETSEFSAPDDISALGSEATESALETSGDVLMGFTFAGPNMDYTIEYEAEACIWIPFWGTECVEIFYLKAGFQLDWDMGLRLPASVSLTGPEQAEQGSEAYFKTSLTPQDWDNKKYTDNGVEGNEGNEFVFSYTFWAGIQIEIFDNETCPLPAGIPCYVDLSDDKSTSFTTPFGPGTSFPIPSIDIEIYTIDVASILTLSTYVTITPLLTSTDIRADWQGSGECSGSGTVSYTRPEEEVTFGPVKFCDTDNDLETDDATVELSNFRYYFNDFRIQLGGKVAVNLVDVYSTSWEKPFYTLNLSPIFGGLGLYIGDHNQCRLDASFHFTCGRAGPSNRIGLTVTTSDTTPPLTSITLTGDKGTNDWFVSDAAFSLAAEDDCGSGVIQTEFGYDGQTWTLYTGPVTVHDDGKTTVYYRSVDNDGNVETARTQLIKIDQTPPSITGDTTVEANEHGWWQNDVTVHFDASDAVSGISSLTPDAILSTEAAGQSVTGTAVDGAGNSASFTVGNIHIDMTAPVIHIVSPEAKFYANGDPLTIQWEAEDPLSAVDVESANLNGAAVTNGQSVDLLLLPAGNNALTVYAHDFAHNPITSTVEFTLEVDLDGLITSVEHMCELGWIRPEGACTALLAKLNAARNAINRGNITAARNGLNATVHTINVWKSHLISEEAAWVITANILYVLDHFPYL